MAQGLEDLRAIQLYGYRYMDIWRIWPHGHMDIWKRTSIGIWRYGYIQNIHWYIDIQRILEICMDMDTPDHSITQVYTTQPIGATIPNKPWKLYSEPL